MKTDLTSLAQAALSAAQQQARSRNHDYVGTEHLLLGLMQSDGEVVRLALGSLGVSEQEVRLEIDHLIHPGSEPLAPGTLPLTPRAQEVVAYAEEEARLLGQRQVDTAHLFLGLLREPDGVAGRVLRNLDARPSDARAVLLRTRFLQLTLVERAVRPLRAGVASKRAMREELLSHLSAIFDEERAHGRNSAEALAAAQRRFGDPAELAVELEAALPRSEWRAYYFEQWFGWRAPESAARYMTRMARLTFFAFLIPALMVAAATALWVADGGWTEGAWRILRATAALVVVAPLVQFALGLAYFNLRDALLGAPWAHRSLRQALLLDMAIALVMIAAGLGFVAVVNWEWASATQFFWPICGIATAIALINLYRARMAGPGEIVDTIWACLNLEYSPSRETS